MVYIILKSFKMEVDLYDPQFYDLKLIHKTRNEIYRGISQRDPSLICIFKYTNDLSPEISIMIHLQERGLNIPVLYDFKEGDIISPSGTEFNKLLVMSEVQGKLLTNSRIHDNLNEIYDSIPSENIPDRIDMDLQPLEDRKQLIIKLVHLIIELHQLGVIYGDDFFTNVIVSNNEDPYLIDFGNCFFLNSPPRSRLQTAGIYPVSAHDIFNLLSLVTVLDINLSSNKSWKNMTLNEIISVIN